MGSAVIDALSESGGEEGEYESDSDGTSTLALRRRAASDDEEEEVSQKRKLRNAAAGVKGVQQQDAASSVDEEGSRVPYSDDEEVDDVEGAVPLYEEEEEEEEELLEEDEQEEGREGLSRQLLRRRRRRKGSDEEEDEEEEEEEEEAEGAMGIKGEDESGKISKQGKSPMKTESGAGAPATDGKEVTEEEKKEAEPFVVPTAGAFYMHDDRFRDNGGARPRRSMAGRKLWEAKDDKLWVHDLFEELNLQNEKTTGEGFHRGGRGRGRGGGRGRGRDRAARLNDHDEGRGGMRSQAMGRGRVSKAEASDSAAGATNYGTKTFQEAASASTIVLDGSGPNGKHSDNAVAKKAASGSYLNSASPPFIPSGALQQKLSDKVESTGDNEGIVSRGKGRDQYGGASTGPVTKSGFTRAGTDKIGQTRSTAAVGRGAVSDNSTHSSWSQDDAVPSSVFQQVPKAIGSVANQQQYADEKTQRLQDTNRLQGGALTAQESGGRVPSQDQATAFSPSTQSQGQPTVSRSSHRPSSSNHVQAPNNARYKNGAGGRGARMNNIPVGGRGAYVFAGGPLLPGGAGLPVGDPAFQSAPAVGAVPVPYGAQSRGGIGAPGVGMPIPNYPYGYPNSEVTWVPVLAGGGAIGGAYGAPYIALEGAPSHMYYAQPAAQAVPYHLPGRDMNGAKPPGGLWKPPPSPELGSDEFEQRQSKPRRYSEMNFGQ